MAGVSADSDKPLPEDAAAAAPESGDREAVKHAIHSDHYAWAKDMAGREVQEQSPEQLDEEKAVVIDAGDASSGSAWNTAGTW